jgi:hypothetical protein
MQRIFEIAMRAFHARNFAPGSPANRLMGTRFDVEVARHFHPELFRAEWLDEAKRLGRRLVSDSVQGLREIVSFVGRGESDEAFQHELSLRLRKTERVVSAAASKLEEAVQQGVGTPCRHWRTNAGISNDRSNNCKETRYGRSNEITF